jgi:hypothetical protein
MTSPRTQRRAIRFAGLALLLGCAAGPLLAQATDEEVLPSGLTAGRWIFSPYARTSFGVDSNLFRSNTEPQRELVTRVAAGALATLPFRNSVLDLFYEASLYDYAETQIPTDITHRGGVSAGLQFGTGDVLTLRERFTTGQVELRRFDPGGEVVFEGEPYNYNVFDLEMARSDATRPGYSARLSRVDFAYADQPPNAAFFDYSGYNGAFEYRHPLPNHRWAVGSYRGRRFNHYRDVFEDKQVIDPETGNTVTVPVRVDSRVKFRTEISDTLLAGVRGFVGRRQPFWALAGYGRFEYENQPESEFQGIVGTAQWRLPIGTRTFVDFGFDRRPLPSTFDTYYIVNELRTRAEGAGFRNARVGANLILGRNRYGSVIDDEDNDFQDDSCEGQIRKDSRFLLEGYLNWVIHPRVAFQLTAARTSRGSNCNWAEYNANVVTTSFIFGWTR